MYTLSTEEVCMKTNNTAGNGTPHVCPHQFAIFLDNRIRRLFQSPKRIIGEYIREDDTVIDVGCGPGFFTIDMARMVGEGGKVIAVDLQPKMLDRVRKKAIRHGVHSRMVYHQCGERNLRLDAQADFILACYMIHETPDPAEFLSETRSLLKKDGRLLVVEPKMHVGKTEFEIMITTAGKAGLKAVAWPKGKGGRSVLLAVEG